MNLSEKEIKNEKNYLDYTLKIIRGQISELGQQLYEKQEKIMEFKKFIWNSKADMDPTEMKTMINASDLEVALASYKSNHMQKLYKVQSIIWHQLEVLQVQNYELKDAETSPPSRYNSGSMILAMENAGKLIGIKRTDKRCRNRNKCNTW